MKKERIEYIDLAKGIAILLMFAAHVDLHSSYLLGCINSFHMPVFFVLAGFFTRHSSIETIKYDFLKNVKRILVPYFLICFFITVYFVFFQLFKSLYGNPLYLNQILDFIIFTLTGNSEYTQLDTGISVVWFLFALFWGKMVLSTLDVFMGRKALCLTVFILFLASGYLPEKYNILYVIQGLKGLAFIYVGRELKDMSFRFDNDNTLLYWSPLLILFGYLNPVYMFSGYYKFSVLSVLISTCLSVGFVALCSRMKSKSCFSRISQCIGRNSIVFLLCEAFVLTSQITKVFHHNIFFIISFKIVFSFFCLYILSKSTKMKKLLVIQI